MAQKIDWTKIADFALENKRMFFMVASPDTDEILFFFNGLNGFVRFPMISKDKGVVFNALRKSKFEEAIEPFMEGVVKGTGITTDTPEGNELLKTIGGAVKSLGVGGNELREKIKQVNEYNGEIKKRKSKTRG